MKKEYVHTIDFGNFYRVPCDKYFVDSDQDRVRFKKFSPIIRFY